jgi:hypothetical protein
MRWPREDFPLTVAPQVGGKNLVRHREIGEDQLTGAQERCQGLRYGGRLAKEAIQAPALQVGDAIDIVWMLGQDGPTRIAQEFDSGAWKRPA